MATNRELLGYAEELKSLRGSIVLKLLNGRIGDFNKHNGVRIHSLYDKMNDLAKKHFEYDEKGEIKWSEGVLDMNGKPKKKRLMLEGKTEEDYLKEREALLNEEVDIRF